MEITDQLRCLFSGKIEERNGSYIVEVPEQEIQRDSIQTDETYRVAVLSFPTTNEASNADTDPHPEDTSPTPAVAEGDQRTVEIEDIGDKATELRVSSVGSSLSFLTPNRASVSPSRSPMCVKMSPSRKVSSV